MYNPDPKRIDIIFTYLKPKNVIKEHWAYKKVIEITLSDNTKITFIEIRISPNNPEWEINFIATHYITWKRSKIKCLISQ